VSNQLTEELANEATTMVRSYCLSNLSQALQNQANKTLSEFIGYDLIHSE
jgi:hypothetical protein